MEKKSELKEAFDLFDSDKNGEISQEELFGLFAKLGNGLPPTTLRSYWVLSDRDSSGGIDFEEFSVLWGCIAGVNEEKKAIREEFDSIDVDGDGFISTGEMMSVVDKFSHVLGSQKDVAQRCVQDIDINGDGKVSFPEFLIVWKYKKR